MTDVGFGLWMIRCSKVLKARELPYLQWQEPISLSAIESFFISVKADKIG